jgi:hypothetical protein
VKGNPIRFGLNHLEPAKTVEKRIQRQYRTVNLSCRTRKPDGIGGVAVAGAMPDDISISNASNRLGTTGIWLIQG